jgi:hypothetical protein
MDNQKSSPLALILSAEREEADRERRYDSILSGQAGASPLRQEERGRVRS